MTIRVLVVDDHPLFLDGVRAAVTGAEDVEIVGEATDARGAVTAAAELAPDVVLLDVACRTARASTSPARSWRPSPVCAC